MKKFNLNTYDIFIFDCDGVILNSNKLKNKIFLESIKKFSKKNIQKFEKYIRVNKGYSRYKLFDFFFKSILKLNSIEYTFEYNEALNFYNSSLKKKYSNCKYIPGVINFIKKNNNKKKYIISGSDQKELIKVFKLKKIDKYFKKIMGSPTLKIDNAITINHKMDKTLKKIYFGDSYYDYLVAKKINADFIFISGFSDDKKLFNIKKINKFNDFTTL